MALDPSIRAEIEAQLALGKSPTEIANERDGKPTYLTILNIKKKMAAQEEKKEVQELVTIEPHVMHTIVEKAKEEAPAKVVAQLEKVEEGVKGLQLLDTKFHSVLAKAVGKAEKFLDQEDLKPAEWVAITNALASAYSSVFNSKGVNVNVNISNNFSDTKLSMFKGAMRG